MNRKKLMIGGFAIAALMAGGWAVAQTTDRGPGERGPYGFGSRAMQHGEAGRDTGGMHGRMGRGMHGQSGPGMRGRMGGGMGSGSGESGHGMMGGSATAGELGDIHDLFSNHDSIQRKVTNLPDGIRTVTESNDPKVAETIKRHVAEMGKRVEEGRDPGLPIETPALRAIFRYKDSIKSAYEVTEKGVVVVQTSTNPEAVKALQEHAAEVSELARRGMAAAHEGMMRNGGMMHGAMMHGGGRGR